MGSDDAGGDGWSVNLTFRYVFLWARFITHTIGYDDFLLADPLGYNHNLIPAARSS